MLRGAVRRLDVAAHAVVEPPDVATMRREIVQRALVVAAIVAVVPIQEMRIPGWPAVVAACIFAFVCNIPLAYLVWAKGEAFLARALGLVVDALALMGASFVVMRGMGEADAVSNIWLVFLLYIVNGSFRMTPVGSLAYTTLWMVWPALGALLFFSPANPFRTQLPVNLLFFAAIGLITLGVARELQKRRTRLEQQNRQTMATLATLVEARDTHAGAHLQRIQHFSRALALHIGLLEREAREIAYASMVHDVGKANVPDAILKKPGKLNEEEWRIMRDHTSWGDHLMSENSDFDTARRVVRWHHEHWDGRGYPDGLAGEEIPLGARIVAIADVYDALISKRPYKEAWPPEAAIRELHRLAGSHLDPELVAAFVDLWNRGTIQRITEEAAGDGTQEGTPIDRAA
jgi:hypothetical protein